MILFKRITYRNFLSSGNQETEINLLKSKTTLIIGSNGSGKSTMLDAICFCLFNKAFRKINRGQLVNSTNEKDCLVTVEFDIGSKKYKIIRGIKPNVFEIWVNGKIQNQAASANDQQKYLEENILKLNYKSFTQIVILGNASFVPFMQLSSANRREIVEDILDIKIFSVMNGIIKDRIRKNNEEVKNFTLSETMTIDKIEMQKEFIDNIKKNGEDDIEKNRKKILSIESETNSLFDLIKIKEEESSELQEEARQYSESTEKLKKLGGLKGKLSQKVSSVVDEHKFFSENNVCPTCTQNIDDNFKTSKIEETLRKVKELKNGYDEIIQTIKEEEEREKTFLELTRKITSITNDITGNNIKISSNNKQIRTIEGEIKEIENKLKNQSKETKKLRELKTQLEEIKKNNAKLKDELKYLDFSHNLLKDGGIKAKVIKKYLPIMNVQINKYLNLMDFYINFNFDEEFNENIKTPIHQDFTYESFSEGEKMRINLAILFTWREIAKMKNSVNTNLLILDEVFDSSLDFTGTDQFTKIIKYIIKDSNIFVISHKTDELIDKFDRVIKVEKVKGFSKMIT
jgi:DNA repair exonuclease SbcCD ATPase subunit